MRKARFKPLGVEAWYHLYNQACGYAGDRLFGPAEKAHFLGLIRKLSTFYTVEIAGYQIMSNHFHLIAYAPAEPPAPEEAAARYEAYYEGCRKLHPGTRYCRQIAERMRDISWFMHDLQQQFSSWYNRTRPERRRGSLWADRFKHTLLESGQALWDGLKYVEMNATRARMVKHPRHYRYGSYGQWIQSGVHPCEQTLHERLLPALAGADARIEGPEDFQEALESAFAEAIAKIEREDQAQATRPAGPNGILHRRVGYWTDGGIIGSEAFVRDMIARSGGIFRIERMVRGDGPGALCAGKAVRAV